MNPKRIEDYLRGIVPARAGCWNIAREKKEKGILVQRLRGKGSVPGVKTYSLRMTFTGRTHERTGGVRTAKNATDSGRKRAGRKTHLR